MVDDLEGSPAPKGRSLEPGSGRIVADPAGAPTTETTIMEIAEALARIRDLQDEAGRSTLARAIGEALGAPLLLPGSTSPRVFLYNLVAACRESPGGMEALVRAVDFLAGHTVAAATIRRLVSPARNLLESSQEMQVRELLKGLTVPSLARLYYTAADNSGSPASRQLADAWDAFCILLDANAGPDGLPPHLVFVELLIQMMRRQAASGVANPHERGRSARLREWMDLQLEGLRKSGEESAADHLERIRDHPGLLEVRSDLPIYLIIQLEPIPDLEEGRELYRLSHWRQLHPLQWRPEPGEARTLPLHQVPGQVAELIQEAEGGWAYQLDDSLVLEFVLPFDLLNLELDQWTRDPPDTPHPTPLGTEYEVLVRSHERLHTLNLHRSWRRRWRVLADAIECATHWASIEPPSDPQRLRDRLMTRKNVVACVLSCPPDREPGRTELKMALRAGIPVVLWNRTDDPAHEFRNALRTVVERSDLRSLPSDVKMLRGNTMSGDPPSSNPRAGDEHTEQWPPPRLTLLWDDPNHFLDDASPLRPPRLW